MAPAEVDPGCELQAKSDQSVGRAEVRPGLVLPDLVHRPYNS